MFRCHTQSKIRIMCTSVANERPQETLLTRYGRIRNQEVGMNGYFVCHRLVVAAISLGAAESDAAIETIALASLNEEQFRFAG